MFWVYFRVFVEQNNVTDLYAEAYEGDVVGCGFDIADVTFEDDGIPCSNQFLNVYFTRNGGEVGYLLYNEAFNLYVVLPFLCNYTYCLIAPCHSHICM